MAILFLLFIALAVGVFYLSLNHQGWRAQALSKKFRVLASLLLIAALCCGSFAFSLGTTIFAIIIIAMLLLILFPFLSLLKTPQLKPSQIKKGARNVH